MKNIKNLWANKSSKVTKASVAALAVAALSIGTVAAAPLHATGGVKTITALMGKAKDILQEIYKGLLGIVTVLAVVICAWCFCVKMFSKNPRSIDEANQWMKRVAIAWLCFMLLSVFVAVGLDIVTSSGAKTDAPWS